MTTDHTSSTQHTLANYRKKLERAHKARELAEQRVIRAADLLWKRRRAVKYFLRQIERAEGCLARGEEFRPERERKRKPGRRIELD